ncbi:MAG TPA: RNA pseudouridine synthase [Candidatus Didemnitutus sp.]|nr:RNA pseudouridine synthase [Candidatus Didemnitutus sp.]
MSESIPLNVGATVLTRDAQGLLALDKPAGVLSHPNRIADQPRSLLNATYDLEQQVYRWKTPNGGARCLWLLNRLDGATSGVILLAENLELARAIRLHFAQQRVHKVYVALVHGKPAEKRALWRDVVAVEKSGGKIRTRATAGHIPAETAFQFLGHFPAAMPTSLIRLEPHTGRSHQLRVQCAKRHLPIVGDQTYGDFAKNRAFVKATGEKRLFLHSLETEFTYTLAGKRHRFRAEAPLPVEFPR